ncbi:hypothetical protein K440DRAFT_48844 [Wilcoxina mikolae CBS 423.85]|nr:hypothetical protein K440DRAFT_48844 [Wilcoxina mikolae CBS 423.85]
MQQEVASSQSYTARNLNHLGGYVTHLLRLPLVPGTSNGRRTIPFQRKKIRISECDSTLFNLSTSRCRLHVGKLFRPARGTVERLDISPNRVPKDTSHSAANFPTQRAHLQPSAIVKLIIQPPVSKRRLDSLIMARTLWVEEDAFYGEISSTSPPCCVKSCLGDLNHQVGLHLCRCELLGQET